ncbi:MAG: metallopeptidase TldD-related protein, partial [Candidatus Aminicenantes bacterium]|nr:metallopeptidase TldD-related protein [Candidatus Aminicenantes bacterium]
DVDSIINATLGNRTPLRQDKIESRVPVSISELKKTPRKFFDTPDIPIDSIYTWLDSESVKINETTGYNVYYLSYQIEEIESFYTNTEGNCASFTTAKTHFNTTIMKISEGQMSVPISFYFMDIEPFSPLSSRVCAPGVLSRLADNSQVEFVKLSGVTHFPGDVVSSILPGLAASFNIDLVLSGASFIRLSDIGKSLFDSAISLIDDPLEFGNGKTCFSFDMEGTKAAKKPLIKEGIINDLLCDREKSQIISRLSPGNCFRELPDINLKITHSNLILSVDKNQGNFREVENYLQGTGMQAFFDAGTGRVKGTAKGIRKNGDIRKTVYFSLDFSIKEFFSNCIQADSYNWVNGNYVPDIITDIKNEM